MAEIKVREKCSLGNCGKPVMAKGFCPQHYFHQKVHGTPTKPCAICGSATTTKYCGPQCRVVAINARDLENRRARGIKSNADEIARRKAMATRRNCKHCGEEFLPGRSKISLDKRRGLYCSKVCVNEGRRKESEPKKVARQAELSSRRLATAIRRATKAIQSFAYAIGQLTKPCMLCGGPRVGRMDGRGKVCANCIPSLRRAGRKNSRAKQKLDPIYRLKRKAHRRADKARRRAIEKGLGAERFDPFEIFNRDGWRCHICGVKTPKGLRGSYDDRAPELDHILPLAAGGNHTRINTACACRKCNILKAARPMGQMRLVA